jgi:hypothetical protein
MNVYGGVLKRNGTFIEYTKSLINQLNAHYTEQPHFMVDVFTRTTNTIHYYDSIVLFKKRVMENQVHKKLANLFFNYDSTKKTYFERIKVDFLTKFNRKLQSYKIKGFFINEMIRLSGKGEDYF